jgi:hypothetical protein
MVAQHDKDLVLELRYCATRGISPRYRRALLNAEDEIERLRDVLRQIAGMKREDLYLADSELPIDNAAAWAAKNALAKSV